MYIITNVAEESAPSKFRIVQKGTSLKCAISRGGGLLRNVGNCMSTGATFRETLISVSTGVRTADLDLIIVSCVHNIKNN